VVIRENQDAVRGLQINITLMGKEKHPGDIGDRLLLLLIGVKRGMTECLNSLYAREKIADKIVALI